MLNSGFWIGLLLGASLIGMPVGLLVHALCAMAKDLQRTTE